MSIEPAYFAYAAFGSVITCLVLPPFWLLMLCITPKRLTYRFFRDPHFTLGELVFMSQFPWSLFRVIVLATATTAPSVVKKRQLQRVPYYAPGWYQVIAKIFIYYSLFQIIFLFSSLTLAVWTDPDINLFG